jgi:hypothetical protein
MKYQGAARLRPLSFVERIIAAAREVAEMPPGLRPGDSPGLVNNHWNNHQSPEAIGIACDIGTTNCGD